MKNFRDAWAELEPYASTHPMTGQLPYFESAANQGGAFKVPSKSRGGVLRVFAGTGGGWDHVSVSRKNEIPTWEEMCQVKDLFFTPDEWVVQFHPATSEYVNYSPHCLHLWRPQEGFAQTPPSWMVGPKVGETPAEAYAKGAEALLQMEALRG